MPNTKACPRCGFIAKKLKRYPVSCSNQCGLRWPFGKDPSRFVDTKGKKGGTK